MRKAVDGRAMALMLGLCFAWGLQQVAIKAVSNDISPLLQVSVRSGVAACLVWLFGRFVARDRWLPGVSLRAGVVVGTLFAFEFLLIAKGLLYTSASHMAVFLYTAPLFAAIGLHVRLPEERLSPVQWAGIALSFSGVAVAFLIPALSGHAGADASGWLMGDFLGLCAGAVWGMTTVTIRTTRLSEAPPTQTLFCQLAGAFVILLPIAWATHQMQFVNTGLVWASLLFQTVIVSFASFLLWFWLLRHYLAARLGVLTLTTPLFGVALAAMLLQERITPAFAAGGALVLLGLFVVNGERWLRSLTLRHT
jgi:drug/metabolite transporter (DMT)-like permease